MVRKKINQVWTVLGPDLAFKIKANVLMYMIVLFLLQIKAAHFDYNEHDRFTILQFLF